MSWRQFDDVAFTSCELRNAGGDANTAPFGFQQFDNASLAGYTVSHGSLIDADTAAYGGGNAEADDSERFCPVLRLERTVTRVRGIDLGLTLGLQYCRLSISDQAGAGDFDAHYYRYQVYDDGGTLRIDPQPPLGGWPQGPFDGFSNLTSARVSQRFAADIWVFDAGVTAAVERDRLRLLLGTGLSLNACQSTSSRAESATWIKPGTTEYEGYSSKDHDRSNDLLPGFYVAASAEFAITPAWSVAADLRYDWVDGHANTQHAGLDLDSASAALRVVRRF